MVVTIHNKKLTFWEVPPCELTPLKQKRRPKATFFVGL
ncbi:hypothetical protein VIBNISOn1_280035 [Vibrio nigripulchritudo SOn1]|uniref:Transposase n=1 Tax=Vibrio nigripulchritudo SOn1 TaxID=1238450 RepID=A0AAV2VRH2_9VIBR|nr:hypothetical protein VIBNISOn1_280035 [Vibrio nigripulchritudo SOn1]